MQQQRQNIGIIEIEVNSNDSHADAGIFCYVVLFGVVSALPDTQR
jgi:hypothetical protein